MKNRILKVSLLSLSGLMLSFGAFAQEKDRVWSIGSEIGASFSKHGQDDDSQYNTGLVAGAFITTYCIPDMYAFTAKILFNQKGSTYKEGGLNEYFNEDGEIKERLNYIEIPVLVRVYFNREGTIRPNVFIGPSFGFLTRAQWKIGDDDYEDWEDFGEFNTNGDYDSYKDVYGVFDFGLSFGLGLSIRVANKMYFIIDTRYTHGSHYFTGKGWDTGNNLNATVTAGLSFGIGN